MNTNGKLVYAHTWVTPRDNVRPHARLTFIGPHWQEDMAKARVQAKRRGVRLRRVIREWGVHKNRVGAT